jgi:hypothetical protein
MKGQFHPDFTNNFFTRNQWLVAGAQPEISTTKGSINNPMWQI